MYVSSSDRFILLRIYINVYRMDVCIKWHRHYPHIEYYVTADIKGEGNLKCIVFSFLWSMHAFNEFSLSALCAHFFPSLQLLKRRKRDEFNKCWRKLLRNTDVLMMDLKAIFSIKYNVSFLIIWFCHICKCSVFFSVLKSNFLTKCLVDGNKDGIV